MTIKFIKRGISLAGHEKKQEAKLFYPYPASRLTDVYIFF